MTDYLLAVAVVIVINAFICMYRAIAGPTAQDRLLAVNIVSTKTLIVVVLVTYHLRREFLPGRGHGLRVAELRGDGGPGALPGDGGLGRKGGEMIVNIVSGVFCAIGAFFFILGTTGLLRMPDLYTRLHPATKCDTLGGCSVIIGMMVYVGWSWDLLRLLVIASLLLISSATCGHAIGRSAFLKDLPVWRKPEQAPSTEEEGT